MLLSRTPEYTTLKENCAQIPQCTCPISYNTPHWNRNVHISVGTFLFQSGVLWDMGHCGICEMDLSLYSVPGTHVCVVNCIIIGSSNVGTNCGEIDLKIQ